ncbi:hypothetical protein ABPG77_003824 [Micractinium sp. CCAP 211/92]
MMAPQDAGEDSWQPGVASQSPAPAVPAAALPAPAPAPPPIAPGEAHGDEAPPPPPPPQLVVDRGPGMLAAVETSTSAISLQWAPVSCTVISPRAVAVEYILNYQLQMQQVDEKSGAIHPDRWSVQYTGTATFVQVKGLRPGRRYAARVLVQPTVTNLLEVVVVPPPPSDVVAVETLPCAPMGQPAPQLASRAKKELKFKWNEPEETGGRALEYTLEMCPAPEGWDGPGPSPDGFFEVAHGPERSYLAKRLVPGVQYCVRVKAANSEGESAWSPLGVFYTSATVPSWSPSDAPFVWDTTATSVTLGWPEPAANGGTVTGYEVEMDDGSGFRHVARSAERQCTVHGLHSGILYKFRVRAENEAGRSLWSPLGEGRTAAVPPGPCGTPALMGSSQTSLSIRWEGPEDDGGSAIQSYDVEIRPKSAAAVQGLADEWLLAYQGRDTACTISNLRAGCVYMIRACAISEAGRGAYGGAAMLQTAPGNPDCPGVPLVAARQQTELTLTWAPPLHDGGRPIITYRLEMCSLGSVEGPSGDGGKGKGKVDPGFELAYLGPQCGAVVTDLEPGHRYSFRCSAMSEQGSSGWGLTMQAETLPGLPFEVDSLHLVAAAPTSLKLRWSRPFGRGARVNSYVLEVAITAVLEATQAAHAAQQAAAAAQQQEQLHELAAAQGGQGAPALVQDQQQQPQTNGLYPSSSSGFDEDAHFWPAYQGPDSSCTVGGLEPFTSYTLRVRAQNAVGCSLSEAQAFQTAPAAPSSPQGLHLQHASPAALSLAWQPPASDHGSPLTGYQLEWARGSRTSGPPANAWRPAYQGTATEAQVPNLEAGSRYQLRVRAGNAVGWGPWSEPLAAATAPDVPAAPAGLSAKAVGTAVRAAWEAPEDNGAPISAYELEAAPAAGQGSFTLAATVSGDTQSARVLQLEPNSGYRLRVRAVNAVGPGPHSQEVSVQTSRAPPSPPSSVAATLVASTAAAVADSGSSSTGGSCEGPRLQLSWVPAEQAPEQAAVLAYEVEAAPVGGGGATGPLRQTCASCACSGTISGLHPGATYTVRVRAVGADNSGHSEWVRVREGKEDRRFRVPGPPPPQRANSAAASEGAGGGSVSGKPQKRRGGSGGGGEPKAPRAVAVTKTVAARAPPKKGWAAVEAWLRRKSGLGVYGWLVVAVAVGILVLFLGSKLLP